MSYDQYSVDQAKKKGLFKENVFDPKALKLSEEEKEKFQKELLKHTPEGSEPAGPEVPTHKIQKSPERKSFYVELNLFETIFVAFISIFSKTIAENYKLKKALKIIEKNLTRNKPAVFNPTTQRVTRFFAYKMHDVYIKILTLKKILDKTLGDPESWENPERIHKTGLELFFEKIININSKEVDSNFSYQGIGRIIADFEPKMAGSAVERSIKIYLASIDKNSIAAANMIYTNLIYTKDLVDYDFIPFFKRFDPQYVPGTSPTFNDITLEALQPYLLDLETTFLQIDLSMDNVFIFKTLSDVGYFMTMLTEKPQIIEEARPEEADEASIKERLVNDFIIAFDTIKEIMTRNYFTLFLALIKKDPAYTPSLIYTKYDFFKIYSETFEKRASFITKFILKEKRTKKLDAYIKKNFNSLKWIGIYNIETSGKIEEFDTIGFTYCYHIGTINTFLSIIYDEHLKEVLNLTVNNGLFIEKYFQKTVSDTFYIIEKFIEKLHEFNYEINSEGISGKKILNLLMKKEGNPVEAKKNLDRNVSYVNMKAKELFEEFYPNFSIINDIISKLYDDIDTNPPKYLRNIHTIGGLKNSKYLKNLIKSHESLNSIKELFNLLKE